MHPLLRPKQSAFREHGERLRRSHAAAQTLCSVFPQAALVKVQLRFLPASTSPHAVQSFALYPRARAYFPVPAGTPPRVATDDSTRPEAKHVDGTHVR